MNLAWLQPMTALSSFALFGPRMADESLRFELLVLNIEHELY
jgi:hypothetical protein